jgi:Flp pilus assembly pilin Flp
MPRKIIDIFARKEEGQTLVEYSLIISLIAIVALSGMMAMGGGVEGLYGVLETAADAMSGGGT